MRWVGSSSTVAVSAKNTTASSWSALFVPEFALGMLPLLAITERRLWRLAVGKLVVAFMVIQVALILTVLVDIAVVSALVEFKGIDPTTTPPANGLVVLAPPEPSWAQALAALAKSWVPQLFFLAFASAVAVLSRSLVVTLAVGIGAIVSALVGYSTPLLYNRMPQHWIAAHMGLDLPHQDVFYVWGRMSMDASTARVWLLAIIVVLFAVAIAVWSRREITAGDNG